MTARVFLPASLRADIDAHARSSYPNECCGLLIGTTKEADVFQVTRTLRSDNVTQEDPLRTFEIDPALLIRTQKELRDTPEGIIGYYHSHPNGPARPSEKDRASALEAGKVWLIVGTLNANLPLSWGAFVTESTGDRTIRFRVLKMNWSPS